MGNQAPGSPHRDSSVSEQERMKGRVHILETIPSPQGYRQHLGNVNIRIKVIVLIINLFVFT